MWLNIASKLVPGIIKTGMSIAQNRRRAKEFESVAEMKHAERMANGELEYKKKIIENNNQGWKDEFVLLLVSAPVLILVYSIFSGVTRTGTRCELCLSLLVSHPTGGLLIDRRTRL